jgi:aspartate/methionine/tyrosine aminotransferase
VQDAATGERLVRMAREQGFWIASDEAYSDLWFEGERPGTPLSHGLENLIGMWTLSKRSAMTGYRSGFMAATRASWKRSRSSARVLGNATPDFIQDAAIARHGTMMRTRRRRARCMAPSVGCPRRVRAARLVGRGLAGHVLPVDARAGRGRCRVL